MGAGLGFEETGPDSMEAMEHARIFIWRWGGGLTVILLIVWPVMALPPGVFDKSYFYFWVILSLVWGLVRLPFFSGLELVRVLPCLKIFPLVSACMHALTYTRVDE